MAARPTVVTVADATSVDATPESVVARIDGVGRRGFLYEVSRPSTADGAAGPRLFLYGTIHLGRVGSEPFNRPVVVALRASRRLVLEADPTDADAVRELALSLGRYPDGDSLQRHVPPALWSRVRAFGARLGLSPDRIDRIRPWLLANMVALTQLSGAGLDPMLGSELYLSGFARAAGLPVVEIEGLEAQLRMLAALPDAVQTAQLDEALAEALDDADDSPGDHVGDAGRRTADDETRSGDIRDDGRALFALWLDGDRAGGDALVDQMHRDADRKAFERYFVDVLIDARNRTMADKAEACLREAGDTFFAVGSLHLFGGTGLLSELARRGYRVADLQATRPAR